MQKLHCGILLNMEQFNIVDKRVTLCVQDFLGYPYSFWYSTWHKKRGVIMDRYITKYLSTRYE